MNKFANRIQSEFENILLDMSKNVNTTYSDAIIQAQTYCDSFCKRKNLTQKDYDEIYELCIELVAEWFPDTSFVNYASF